MCVRGCCVFHSIFPFQFVIFSATVIKRGKGATVQQRWAQGKGQAWLRQVKSFLEFTLNRILITVRALYRYYAYTKCVDEVGSALWSPAFYLVVVGYIYTNYSRQVSQSIILKRDIERFISSVTSILQTWELRVLNKLWLIGENVPLLVDWLLWMIQFSDIHKIPVITILLALQ